MEDDSLVYINAQISKAKPPRECAVSLEPPLCEVEEMLVTEGLGEPVELSVADEEGGADKVDE